MTQVVGRRQGLQTHFPPSPKEPKPIDNRFRISDNSIIDQTDTDHRWAGDLRQYRVIESTDIFKAVAFCQPFLHLEPVSLPLNVLF